jgi:hypothetical protein
MHEYNTRALRKKIKYFPARESLVSAIPAEDGKTINLFYSVRTWEILAWRVAIFYVFMVRGRIAAGIYRQGMYEEKTLLHRILVAIRPLRVQMRRRQGACKIL